MSMNPAWMSGTIMATATRPSGNASMLSSRVGGRDESIWLRAIVMVNWLLRSPLKARAIAPCLRFGYIPAWFPNFVPDSGWLSITPRFIMAVVLLNWLKRQSVASFIYRPTHQTSIGLRNAGHGSRVALENCYRTLSVYARRWNLFFSTQRPNILEYSYIPLLSLSEFSY